MKFICFIIILVALYYGYKYMERKHIHVLVFLKIYFYLIASFVIAGYFVISILFPSNPPVMKPVCKNKIVERVDVDGYIPPINTEVDVLCKKDYIILVRDPKGNQFIVPSGVLETYVKGLDEFNEKFTYNISKRKLDACLGMKLDSLLLVAGDYVTAIGNIYEYPHLIAIEDGYRTHGVKVVTNELGIVKEICYDDDGRSGNLFGYLPFYDDIACMNLYASIGMTGSNSLFERFFMLLVNFFILWLIIFIFSRTVGIMTSGNDLDEFNKWTVKIIAIIVAIPTVYCYMLAVLDFYHDIWLLVIIFMVSTIIYAYNFGFEKSGNSIYMCPKCKVSGVYNPKESIIKQEIVGKVHCKRPENPEWINGIWIPEKEYVKKITYYLTGKCTECGYYDTNKYSRKKVVTTTTLCPICGKKMIFSEEDEMFHEYCPSCKWELYVDKKKEHRPAVRFNRVVSSSVNKYLDNSDDYYEKKMKDERKNMKNHFRREMEDYNDKAKYYYDKYEEAVKNCNEEKLNANWYKEHACYSVDEESYYKYAKECLERADCFKSEAEKFYKEYEWNKNQAEQAYQSSLSYEEW